MSEKTIWICCNCGSDWTSVDEPDRCYKCSKTHKMINTHYTETEWARKSDREKEDIRKTYYDEDAVKKKKIGIITAVVIGIIGVFCTISFAVGSDSNSNSAATRHNDNYSYQPNGTYYKDSNGDDWYNSKDANGNDWHYNMDNGYSVYKRNDGATEITDGYGNWAADTDGDGKLDQFGSDNY